MLINACKVYKTYMSVFIACDCVLISTYLQDDQEDISFENYIKNMDHPERSNIYNPEDDYYYYDIILRPPSRSNRYRSEDGYVLRLNNNDTPTIDGDTNADDDASNDETLLLRNIYKRVTNSRNSDAIYRRNGVDKKIKPKSPIRCLVNPVTCFK